MSSSYEEQRKEIEQILKEIYKNYHYFYSEQFMYKEKNGSLHREPIYLIDYKDMLNIVLNQDLEYVIYIGVSPVIVPSDCVSTYVFTGVVDQFISDLTFLFDSSLFDYRKIIGGFIEIFSGVTFATGSKDPLSQILAYNRLLTTKWPRHVYFCSQVYRVKPYDPDPASLFPSKEGVVAYCMSLRDLVLAEVSVGILNVHSQLRQIVVNTVNKLWYNKELYKLWKQDPVKACDINLIKTIIHDEIQEANEFMKQYGIVRVTFPIDKLGS